MVTNQIPKLGTKKIAEMEGQKIPITEGRIVQIALSCRWVNSVILDQAHGQAVVIFSFKDEKGYICVFDHRVSTYNFMCAARSINPKEWSEKFYKELGSIFRQTPCVGGLRVKIQGGHYIPYVILSDIGTTDIHDGGSTDNLTLTVVGHYNKKTHRITALGDAQHKPTGICLIAPRT